MANLIPPYAKKSVVIEYWIRVCSVWFILLGAAALAVASLNVPVYMLIQNQQLINAGMFTDASDQKTSFEKIESEIMAANNTAALLATVKQTTPLNQYVQDIEALANESITVDSYQFSKDNGTLTEVIISGTAANRSSLLDLSDALESDSRFASAEIPLSNLAKDSDIPFMITIVLASEQGT